LKIKNQKSKILFSVSVAESCTAGGIGWALTTYPGSSGFFKGGIIAYSNEVKNKFLKVSAETLEKEGAVSEKVAKLMAENVRKIMKTTYGVSVTGIAGPDGGTKEKPVGTVWFAVAAPGKTFTEKKLFSGTRKVIREKTVKHAIKMLELWSKFPLITSIDLDLTLGEG